jgi:hypothetical protein
MAGAGSFPKVTGDTIYQADYNAIQSLIASVKTTYYGVNCTSAQLSGNPSIDHTTLNYLLTDIDSCITHQTGSASGLSTKNTGDQIGHTDFNNLYNNANTAYTNRNNVFSSTQLAQVANSATSNHPGTGWNTTLTHTVQVDFSSAAAANYFFQTGGYLYATASSSGGTGSAKDVNWASLISSVGNRTYGLSQWNAGGNITISTLYGSSVYSSNFWRLSVNKTTTSQVVMTMLFDDAAGGNPNFDELVYLNITSAVGYYKSISPIVGTTPSAFTNTSNI